jgi:hypothetical protein
LWRAHILCTGFLMRKSLLRRICDARTFSAQDLWCANLFCKGFVTSALSLHRICDAQISFVQDLWRAHFFCVGFGTRTFSVAHSLRRVCDAHISFAQDLWRAHFLQFPREQKKQSNGILVKRKMAAMAQCTFTFLWEIIFRVSNAFPYFFLSKRSL